MLPDTGKFNSSYIIGMNVCGSSYENGCMVDDTCAMAADRVLYYLIFIWIIIIKNITFRGKLVKMIVTRDCH